MKSVLLTGRILCAVTCALTARAGDLFLGPVPVQYVKSGSTITLDLHRFYQPTKTSQFHTAGADALQVSFNRRSLQLQIGVKRTARGLINLPFDIKDRDATKESIITFAVQSPHEHEFVFRQSGEAGKVYLGGSFNGWAKDSIELQPDESGVFRRTIPLDPGTYSYKFVVDDRWMSDKSNPLHEPDGFGGNNSILKVGSVEDNDRLTIYADELTKDKLVIAGVGASEIQSIAAIAELPDGASRLLPSTISKSQSTVNVADYLRVAGYAWPLSMSRSEQAMWFAVR